VRAMGKVLEFLLSAFFYFTVSSEVLKAETAESGVLWDVAPGIVLEIAGVTEEHDTSLTKANLRKGDSSTPLRSFGKCLQDYKASHHRMLYSIAFRKSFCPCAFLYFATRFGTFLVYMRRSSRCRRPCVKGSHHTKSQQKSWVVISRCYEVASHRPPEAWLLRTNTKFKCTAGIASPSFRMSLVFSILTCQIEWKRLLFGLATVAMLPQHVPRL
jgi:hypothetical protein